MSDSTQNAPELADGGDPAGVTTRVTGHALQHEGEAYLPRDCYQQRCSTNLWGTVRDSNGWATSTAGDGHALCECGVMSEHLHHGRRRRAWHRQHKARVLAALPEPAGQPEPADPDQVA